MKLRNIFFSLMITTTLCAFSPEEVLNFWFGQLDSSGEYSQEKAKSWFLKDPEFDYLIEARFGQEVIKASQGEYAEWGETAQGRLALIILLDQFPRNIYRGSPNAFSFDPKAQKLTLRGISLGQDKDLYPIERKFFYMPLMHAESIELQNRSLEEYEGLQKDIPEEQKQNFSLKWAIRHWEIIQMFERFPHRNATLGRVSTKQEEIFLQLPNSSF